MKEEPRAALRGVRVWCRTYIGWEALNAKDRISSANCEGDGYHAGLETPSQARACESSLADSLPISWAVSTSPQRLSSADSPAKPQDPELLRRETPDFSCAEIAVARMLGSTGRFDLRRTHERAGPRCAGHEARWTPFLGKMALVKARRPRVSTKRWPSSMRSSRASPLVRRLSKR